MSPLNLFQRVKTAIAEQWARLNARNVGVSELRSCGPFVEAIAADLGMSVNELRRVTGRGPGAARELYDRLSALHVERNSVTPLILCDLERVCSQCATKRHCRSDLKRGLVAINNDYCPNTDTLVALTQAAWPKDTIKDRPPVA